MQKIYQLLKKSGFVLTPTEYERLTQIDYGLGDFESEGVTFVDILLSEKLRIALLILLPHQTLPEHTHPPYENCAGKEETVRAIYGQIKVYVEGVENNSSLRIPKNKNSSYIARHEVNLNIGEQYTILPNIQHWFQANAEGAVMLTFQNRVDESKNVFTDAGCFARIHK